jgi:hypothetical protein
MALQQQNAQLALRELNDRTFNLEARFYELEYDKVAVEYRPRVFQSPEVRNWGFTGSPTEHVQRMQVLNQEIRQGGAEADYSIEIAAATVVPIAKATTAAYGAAGLLGAAKVLASETIGEVANAGGLPVNPADIMALSRQMLASIRGAVSETRGAVTNLGTRTLAENSELFAKLRASEGMSGVFDHTTGRFILRPSENLPVGPLREGWVQQYGGHRDVRADLGEALGEDLLQAAPGRLSGFSMTKNADGTVTFGWRSGQINRSSHGDIAVPESLRSAIEAAVRSSLGL